MVMSTDTSQRNPSPGSFSYQQAFSRAYRFRITLREVQPAVWRCIEVPETYSFWDLHVALTDAFGWWDSHLHEWNVHNPETGSLERLGMSDEDDPDVRLDWEIKIADYFLTGKALEALHQYDFGDGWEHLVELEDVHARESGIVYPRCPGGESACPPDDCGGPWGYQELLEIVSDPTHEEYADRIEWLGGMKGIEGKAFAPDRFDPAEVRFDDPEKRWGVAFSNEEMTPDMRMYETFKGMGAE
jgi:hypothetical protein